MPQSAEVREAAEVIGILRKYHAEGVPLVTESTGDVIVLPRTPPPEAASRSWAHDGQSTPSFDLSPSSRQIDPSLFTPRKRARAYAYHVRHSINYDIHLAPIAVDTPPKSPTLECPPRASCSMNSASEDLPDVNEMCIDDLRLELAHHREQSRQAQTDLAALESAVYSQNAKLVLQHDYAVTLQTKLNDKKAKERTSHTLKYLKNGGRRVYTDEEYRDACRRDVQEAKDGRLEKIRRATIRAITGQRTVWRSSQKTHRQILRDRKDTEVKEWQAECDRCVARGDKKPDKPSPVERRAKTPVEFEEWINRVREFDVDELEELEDATSGISGKKQKSNILFDTMKDLLETR